MAKPIGSIFSVQYAYIGPYVYKIYYICTEHTFHVCMEQMPILY